jgi:7-keto-8-aminopelargonate synthetase-like enzyme
MATHQFKFIVSDVDLDDEQVERVGRAVAQAGALAVADQTPEDAVIVYYRPGHVWCGLPPANLNEALRVYANEQEDVAERKSAEE